MCSVVVGYIGSPTQLLLSVSEDDNANHHQSAQSKGSDNSAEVVWQCTGSRNKLYATLVEGAYICCLERAALSVVMKHHLGETEGRLPSQQHSTIPTTFFCAKDDKADDAGDKISLNHRNEKNQLYISKRRKKTIYIMKITYLYSNFAISANYL